MSAQISCQIQLSIPGLNLLPHLLSFSFEGTSLPMQRQQSVEDFRMKTKTFASSPVAWRITRTSGTLCLFLQRRHLRPDPHLRHLRPASWAGAPIPARGATAKHQQSWSNCRTERTCSVNSLLWEITFVDWWSTFFRYYNFFSCFSRYIYLEFYHKNASYL